MCYNQYQTDKKGSDRMKIKLRKLKYRSLKSRISYFVIHLAYIIDFIILVFSLGNYTIDLAENLLFDCKWIDD